MYKNAFTFSPTHHIWLSSNHKPNVAGTDLGLWRRINLVPFDRTFGDAEADRELPIALQNELPGILSWIVRGAVMWFKEGRLHPPEAVIAATRQYREEQDVLAEFLRDCCQVGKNLEVPAKELYAAYRRWADETGEKLVWTSTRFGRRLSECGFKTDRPNDHRGGKVWIGLALLPDPGALRTDEHSSEAFEETSSHPHAREGVFS
jgi:putative DNA primase/helicase